MTTNTHIINRSQHQALTQNNQRNFNRATAIAAPVNMMNVAAQNRVCQGFEQIPNELDIIWLLENFFKKLFRGIA
jgi:hypothetical protein